MIDHYRVEIFWDDDSAVMGQKAPAPMAAA